MYEGSSTNTSQIIRSRHHTDCEDFLTTIHRHHQPFHSDGPPHRPSTKVRIATETDADHPWILDKIASVSTTERQLQAPSVLIFCFAIKRHHRVVLIVAGIRLATTRTESYWSWLALVHGRVFFQSPSKPHIHLSAQHS